MLNQLFFDYQKTLSKLSTGLLEAEIQVPKRHHFLLKNDQCVLLAS